MSNTKKTGKKNPGKDSVLVYIESQHGEIAQVSLELIGKAREMADKLSVTVTAVAIGSGLKKFAQQIFSYGCDTLYLLEDKRLAYYETIPYTKALVQAIGQIQPQIALFGATSIGRDIAPRVASTIKVGLTADCTSLEIGDHEDPRTKKTYQNILYQIRPAFGGNIIATIVSPEHRPQMATVREGVMKLGMPDKSRKGVIVPLKVKFAAKDFVNHVIKRVISQRKVNLTAAHIIVSGGAGVGSRENFKLIWDFAEAIGGVVGGSRAAVDNGFVDHDHQVGQTGTTVRPKLYIACGISGAIQHRAGMEHASKIIAINSDPNAPMLKIAHYGIVGDLNQVIPKMIKAYKSKG
ncbi:MAG: electron transfer flavoprotein subunit alpha [Candidatus Raymondbacteria bacterium RifOxyA12_full_50_37]|uniref:Electron transfer flavoprotein subunit alpha n=1 Tax=Candidatus Raymondbacteria bacterium RIFOXYD12_FULL_49_13 TaxID=1817890 RepID=A0A1F7FKC2_UNCRA|nr:MAG: electron transfer flavoprotein subunit alpha [Candidatus Raymondbacteria bacterium RifOxyB12_full_50_8]OGJ91738.1 MAG: electron transfer flavoprotein subunit alpha [Candidatus Raymondbacteria bacterium RifOxyA12_full_50_37]OGJ93498.1 MAG: electron transfer flavoprotein subunit alpha [Candidatus Raymondbacteria bacterium RIFOXYA2_FULL_49_16]OGJ98768.1 MAG: electron transfer flavoprotein subunit alpha [Candidatus Raymondbacteria bacterium RIFOXYC2_FULL_50_21]OGK06937.1 MAG: electron trans